MPYLEDCWDAELLSACFQEVKEAYNDYAQLTWPRRAEGRTLEHRISDLVNQACGLTPEEIELMWKTAPPRMPFQRP